MSLTATVRVVDIRTESASVEIRVVDEAGQDVRQTDLSIGVNWGVETYDENGGSFAYYANFSPVAIPLTNLLAGTTYKWRAQIIHDTAPPVSLLSDQADRTFTTAGAPTIDEGLVAFIKENVTPRIWGGMFPESAFPQNVKLADQQPAVRYHCLGESPIVELDGRNVGTQGKWQLSVYAPTIAGAKQLAAQLVTALSAYSGPLGDITDARILVLNQVDLYDASAQMHHIAIDLDILATN